MKTRILRACTVIAASCFVILGARSQTMTAPATAQPAAPVTVQPVTPPTPLLATTPAAPAPTPAPVAASAVADRCQDFAKTADYLACLKGSTAPVAAK